MISPWQNQVVPRQLRATGTYTPNAVPNTVASLPLPAGTWLVFGGTNINVSGAGSGGNINISDVSGAQGSTPGYDQVAFIMNGLGNGSFGGAQIGGVMLVSDGTKTAYLVVQTTSTGSGLAQAAIVAIQIGS